MLNRIIKYFLENKLVTVLMLMAFIAWGIITAPFGWQVGALPSDPVPVDAIPDIGENQQIVFTQWQGRSQQIGSFHLTTIRVRNRLLKSI